MSSQPVILPDDSLMSYDLGDLGVLNNLPAYNVYEGVDRQLDLTRQVYSSEEYYPLIVPFPHSSAISIPALQQLSGNLSVPPGAMLVSITGHGEYTDENTQAIITSPFKLRVFDSSTSLDLFYGMWGLSTNSSPSMDVLTVPTPDVLGPFYLTDPYMVVMQNAIQVTVMNLSTVAARIQVAFHFAVPLRGIRLTTNAVIEGVN